MLKKAFFVLFLTACATKRNISSIPELNMFDLSQHIGPAYKPSNSPCFDGLLSNLGSSCDGLVEISGQGAVIAIQCHKAKKKDSPWDKYTFFVIGDAGIGGPPGTHQFCADPTTAIYIRQRP
jgi:hypothetical protein